MINDDDFQMNLLRCINDFRYVLETSDGDWTVKGFIDVAKNIYTISVKRDIDIC
ncbi:MAG: hypothetical protein LE178_01805 [Endomicrobium sp.]|jgi:hypothetical protein|nr:hypothetical protein [Endomicrobium sp.]